MTWGFIDSNQLCSSSVLIIGNAQPHPRHGAQTAAALASIKLCSAISVSAVAASSDLEHYSFGHCDSDWA
jgi:hypothetical protein